jgi:transposase
MVHQTIFPGPERRRRWTSDERHRILKAAFVPGAVVAEVARRHSISTSLLYQWRRDALAAQEPVSFAPVIIGEAPSVPAEVPVADTAAITIDLADGTKVNVAASAPERLVTAVLKALRS